MTTRRRFLGLLSSAGAAVAIQQQQKKSLFAATRTQDARSDDVTRFVKIAIGTGGHGHTYPGATVPFGAVQLSPDTFNEGWDWCSGYHASDRSIMGFSHTHLSGTGAADLLDILVMPGTGPSKILPGSREDPSTGYRSRFSHEDEIAQPGYYSVILRDYKIRAELTATERAGLHRYTFPKSDSAHFMVDLHHASSGSQSILSAQLALVGNDTIVGGRSVGQFANGREIYFAMKFSKPFASAEIVSDDKPQGASLRKTDGKNLKVLVHYETTEAEVIYVKTAISSVSIEGAMRNLQAEIPGWAFDDIRHSATHAWQHELSKVVIDTASSKHREIFYTALYHMFLAPTLFDDVDGQYRGMDGKVHQLPRGQHNYSTFSLWDTYRAAHPLYALLQGERVPDMVNSLIRMGAESPDGVPVWPLQGRETGCMSGYHSASVVAEAYIKGFIGIDFAKAFPLFRKRAMDDAWRGTAEYRKYGYIPCDLVEESASRTLDYAYDDWAVAQIAHAAGKGKDHDTLVDRSRNYKNLFDKETGFVRPRFADGRWAGPFDPKEISIVRKWRDYTESNAWQTTFAVQHDVQGLIDLFGSRHAFVQKLDDLFSQTTDLPADTPPDVAGLVGMYAHGNEPSHHIAYLYTYAGAPHKTQERVRSLLETMYDNQPDGLAGNEDCGQMSAWYVISALGFYAVDPVSGNYVFGTPLFNHAEVTIGTNKRLTIDVQRTSPDDKYIQSVELNGKRSDKIWFSHHDIAQGGTITFHLSGHPEGNFGTAEGSAPPSLGRGDHAGS